MAKQEKLNLKEERKIDLVEEYRFEPIKGYPMLNWKGKRPFYSTQYYPAQLKETHGESTDGWYNRIYWGDNLQVMSHLLKEFRGKVDLIYIDPPFDSKADYKKKIQLRGKEVKSDRSSFEEKQYSDIWINDEYLQFMFERLILLRELLADDGSIFLHCDRHKSHLLRCILDEIFGNNVEEDKPGLVNEIVWFYPDSPGRPENRFAPKHDTILWYTKSGKYVFNDEPVREAILEASKKRYESTRYLINSQGKRFEYTGGNSSEDGKIPETVWRIPVVKGNAAESTSYPTQKPEALLRRIILAASNQGDVVLDCFMGSGTTQAVAMSLGRRFIGTDINMGAVLTSTRRLIDLGIGLQSELQTTPVFTSFQVFCVNNYDVFRNPAEAHDLLIRALEIQPLPGNTLFDGEKDGKLVKIMPVNRIATRADLNELLTGFDYKAFEKRNEKNPGKPVEHILLVCMGHEPDLGAFLKEQVRTTGYNIDVEVVDILRDKANLEFKRDSEAKIKIKKDKLVIEQFYPMNLLQKVSLEKEKVKDWKELVESVMIDFNYDGSVLEPTVVDIPEDDELVKGTYPIPENAGTIRVKITDLLSESIEVSING